MNSSIPSRAVKSSWKLSTICYCYLLWSFPTLTAITLHLLYHIIKSFNYITEHHMFTIQPVYMMSSTITPIITHHWVFTVQMKNCDPLVLGPALAILSIPDPVCFSWKFSSANFSPYMDFPPVPLPRVKSPPYQVTWSDTWQKTRTHLNHEVWNNAMETATFKSESLLPGAQSSKILCKSYNNEINITLLTNCLRHYIVSKL